MKNSILFCALIIGFIIKSQSQNPITYGEFSGNSLEAMAAGTLSQNGYMFTLKAKDSVAISGITAPFEPGFSWIYVFKKMGASQGFETDTNAWTKVDSVFAMNYDENYITFTFSQKDIVKNGEQISYYLYVKHLSQAYIRYNYGSTTNAIQTQNEDLILYQGLGVLGYFQQAFSDRKFAGTIHYTKAAKFSCDTLNSFGHGTTNLKGFIFNIKAKDKHIELNQLYTKMKVLDSCANLRIYTKTGIYQGFENDSASWTLMATNKICNTDTLVSQAIASNLNIVVPAGESMAIRVVFDEKNQRAQFLQFDENINEENSFENELAEVSAVRGLTGVFEDDGMTYFLNGHIGLCEKQFQSLNESEFGKISIYPNPSSQNIVIESALNWEELEIANIDGQILKRHHISEGKSIDISDLKAGIYILKSGHQTAKFIKL